MSESNISLTPSDVVGAVQRACAELGSYLQSPALSIDVPACHAHLSRMAEMLSALDAMQSSIAQAHAAANGNDTETAAAN